MHSRYRNKDELNERRRNHAWTSSVRIHTPVAPANIDCECLCHMEIDSVSLPFFFSLFFFRFLFSLFHFYRRRLSLHLNSREPFFFILSHWIMYMEWIVLYRRMSFIPSIYAFIMQYACIVLPFHNAQKSYYVWKWCSARGDVVDVRRRW